MDFVYYIASFFKSPIKRKIFLVLLLVICIIISLVQNCSSPELYDSPEIMICKDCGYSQQLRFAMKLNCPKCGNEMGALWKCMNCSYEFELHRPSANAPYKNEEERQKAIIDLCKCPNCYSIETFLVTVSNMPEKNPAAAK